MGAKNAADRDITYSHLLDGSYSSRSTAEHFTGPATTGHAKTVQQSKQKTKRRKQAPDEVRAEEKSPPPSEETTAAKPATEQQKSEAAPDTASDKDKDKDKDKEHYDVTEVRS